MPFRLDGLVFLGRVNSDAFDQMLNESGTEKKVNALVLESADVHVFATGFDEAIEGV